MATTSPTTFSGFNIANNMGNPLYALTTPPLAGSSTPNPSVSTNLGYMGSPVGAFKSQGGAPWWANPANASAVASSQNSGNTTSTQVKSTPAAAPVASPNSLLQAIQSVFAGVENDLKSIFSKL